MKTYWSIPLFIEIVCKSSFLCFALGSYTN